MKQWMEISEPECAVHTRTMVPARAKNAPDIFHSRRRGARGVQLAAGLERRARPAKPCVFLLIVSTCSKGEALSGFVSAVSWHSTQV